MRAETLRRLTPDWEWQWVDTDIPMLGSSRLWQTLAFRKNAGAAVTRINHFVLSELQDAELGLSWIDKAVFLHPRTVLDVRRRSRRMAHYTPDTAFHQNRSRHFERTMAAFDLLITTKSFELDTYARYVGKEKVLLTTQGYDADTHYPRRTSAERKFVAAFAGLAEPDRMRCIEALIQREVPVRLAGRGWDSFVARHARNPHLVFEGQELQGDAYAEFLSAAWVGLGLLSKRFPELHTTRTFEIPGCGAALATERTADTSRFFDEDEAIFFADYDSLAGTLAELFHSAPESLSAVAAKGRERIQRDGRDYATILSRVLSDRRLK
jgi:spore maturation protein CgeB